MPLSPHTPIPLSLIECSLTPLQKPLAQPDICLDLAFLIHNTASLHSNAHDERETGLCELVCVSNIVLCGLEIRCTFEVFVGFKWRS